MDTIQNISQLDRIPTFFVDRKGVGSLAEAFNRGYAQHCLRQFEFVWFLTNIRFSPDVLLEMEAAFLREPELAAVTPSFSSDHAHIRPDDKKNFSRVPFVEFTCPLVRSSVFAEFPLDERMPYSGHDLDWGYRVHQAGWIIGVLPDVVIGHTYIRHSKSTHPATRKRKALRDAAEEPTKQVLAEKYGPTWFDLLRFKY